jgi:ABC-2 type transport system ATP-binding protein
MGLVGGTIQTGRKVPIIEALKDVTVTLEHGARVGLVGHNGAGKSTLLRLLSGIYEPTRGIAEVQGRVAPVFDLGVGMDPEVSGLENIVVRGLFLGMTRKQMEERVDDIAEFTELGDFLHMPLRTYSTGMRIRLALGVVTSIDPEILLLDEGIGAVDADFMDKSKRRFRELVDRAGLLVFASHSNEFLREICDTAIWMQNGQIHRHGDIEDVLAEYQAARRQVREARKKAAPGSQRKPQR